MTNDLFESLKNFGGMQGILEQAQKMQSEVQRVQAELQQREVEGGAGGGMVTVRVSGGLALTGLKIDPSLVNPNDLEMLEDLVRVAVNEGLRKAKGMMKEEMGKLTGGIPIPGFSS